MQPLAAILSSDRQVCRIPNFLLLLLLLLQLLLLQLLLLVLVLAFVPLRLLQHYVRHHCHHHDHHDALRSRLSSWRRGRAGPPKLTALLGAPTSQRQISEPGPCSLPGQLTCWGVGWGGWMWGCNVFCKVGPLVFEPAALLPFKLGTSRAPHKMSASFGHHQVPSAAWRHVQMAYPHPVQTLAF